uniref:Uncharacterized protein n=1 Tax=Panagrellus redivivus TaxID=6233 RepID=A0A7E4W4X0_PANRE
MIRRSIAEAHYIWVASKATISTVSTHLFAISTRLNPSFINPVPGLPTCDGTHPQMMDHPLPAGDADIHAIRYAPFLNINKEMKGGVRSGNACLCLYLYAAKVVFTRGTAKMTFSGTRALVKQRHCALLRRWIMAMRVDLEVALEGV